MSYHNHRIKFVSFDRILPVIAVANMKNNPFACFNVTGQSLTCVVVSSAFMSWHSYN